jgi:hypothetical protein
LVAASIFAAAMAAGSERPTTRRDVVPERTILLLQQDINALTSGAPDATLYGTAKDADLLRQIAVATRASAQAQLELLRQQNEIIRLLEQLQRGREAVR